MKKPSTLILTTIILLALTFWPIPVQAATPTASPSPLPSLSPSPSLSPAPSDLVNQNIEDRIKKVVEEKATASGEVLAEKAHPKKAWVGTVLSITNQTLTIKTRTATHQASFTADTIFVETPGNKTIKSTDLELTAQVIAMGFIDTNDVLAAKRVLIVTKPTPPVVHQVYLGTITAFDKTKNLLTLNELNTDTAIKVTLTKKTKLTQGQGQKDADTKSLTASTKIIVIASADDDNNLTALRLHLL